MCIFQLLFALNSHFSLSFSIHMPFPFAIKAHVSPSLTPFLPKLWTKDSKLVSKMTKVKPVNLSDLLIPFYEVKQKPLCF